MTDIILTTSMPLPPPRVDIAIRPATLDDLSFIDSLQKTTTKQVGWMPTKQFEGKIAAGHVLVAVATSGQSAVGSGQEMPAPLLPTAHRPLHTIPVGYLIGNDQYFKRDDVGIIYQMNVLPEYRRSLVAASLLKAQFERSAYGCKLYCCWCAQDIDANHFWEAMGFVPLAYRAGSESKSRTHIFWQKRIRQDDTTTQWWFPSQTTGGAIGAGRIVLPIPPGVHWSDAMPLILPSENRETTSKALPQGRGASRKPTPVLVQPPPRRARFTPPGMILPAPTVEIQKKPKAPKPKAVKNDPKIVAAARELRDRWLERINQTPILPSARYEVCRQIAENREMPLLAA
jgi:hypothetical protein